jgi:hypothetical protein
MTQAESGTDSVLESQFGDSHLGPGGAASLGVADPNAGWIVCEGVAGFASLQEGVRRARAAVERGDHGAMQPVPEPVGDFVKHWMSRRHAASAASRQAANSPGPGSGSGSAPTPVAGSTVFVLDDASRIWASRLITYLSQAADASSQRLHFIHKTLAGTTVSLAQVCLSGEVGDKHVYWADARGRGRASHEVRDAFSANGDVLAVLIGPMSANAFEKVSGMLRGQWELRRGSLQRVVLLVTHDSPPPRYAVDALLEDFAGAAQAAYVNLSDAGQCWQALLAAAQGLPTRRAVAPPTPAADTQPVALGRPEASTGSVGVDESNFRQDLTESPALDLLDLYAGSDGLHSVALFSHRGELVVQRTGTSWADEAQIGLCLSDHKPVADPDPDPDPDGRPYRPTGISGINGPTSPGLPSDGEGSTEALRRARQGQALRSLLFAAGLQPPRRLLLESAEAFDIVEPVLGLPTLWLWSDFDPQHIATTHAQALSSRLAFDLGQVLSSHDEPMRLLGFAGHRPAKAPGPQETP